ncbi:MAG: indolepyruvate ferredoxin oxidoreductase, partial [Desulfovibrio sp.]|nr:indolepyruvate ferredoxin oxidoreductase [Desulfovibrio sp.]
MNAKRLRIYFTGVGGQGILTVATLLAHAAVLTNIAVVAGE